MSLAPFAPVGQEAQAPVPEPGSQQGPQRGSKRDRKASKEIATLIEKFPPIPDSVPAFAPTTEPGAQDMPVPEAPTSAFESEIWALEPLEAAVAGIAIQLAQVETAPGTSGQADGSGLRRLSMVQGLIARLRHDAWTRTQAMLDAADVEAMRNPGSTLVDPVRRRAAMVRVGLEANAQAVEALIEKSTRQQKAQSRHEQGTILLGAVLVASVATLAFLLRTMAVPTELHLALASLSAVGCVGLVAWAVSLFVRNLRQSALAPHVPGVAGVLQVLRQPGTTDVEACQALLPVVADLAAKDATRGSESAVTAFAIRAVLGCTRPLGMPWPGAATLVRHSLDPTQAGRWMGAHEYATILHISGIPYGYDQADAVALGMPDQAPSALLAQLGLGPAA